MTVAYIDDHFAHTTAVTVKQTMRLERIDYQCSSESHTEENIEQRGKARNVISCPMYLRFLF